ncbi:hypothetical protein BD626DRAFT_248691 [Schizophyllum amplum]|uniref:Uncharacterized protein n=1 Tax=Schizophyllum amplum TaxID=97359 RepID=A0A550CHD1_9AGAR|nr:hypothetical protein BD626DRAFT_248691 [Auriculariopsis ampla]
MSNAPNRSTILHMAVNPSGLRSSAPHMWGSFSRCVPRTPCPQRRRERSTNKAIITNIPAAGLHQAPPRDPRDARDTHRIRTETVTQTRSWTSPCCSLRVTVTVLQISNFLEFYSAWSRCQWYPELFNGLSKSISAVRPSVYPSRTTKIAVVERTTSPQNLLTVYCTLQTQLTHHDAMELPHIMFDIVESAYFSHTYSIRG